MSSTVVSLVTARGGILGRRKRGRFSEPSTLSQASISAALMEPQSTETGSGSTKRSAPSCQYPDRRCPAERGPARDRWVRELCGSITSRTAPILLDRRDVELALDLSPAAFDRRLRDGKLALENMTMQGDRELYRREQVREILLSSGWGGSMSEWAEIDAMPEPQPAVMTDADHTGCRYIAGEPTPLRRGMFYCDKTLPGESWCARHRRVVWQRTARRRAAA